MVGIESCHRGGVELRPNGSHNICGDDNDLDVAVTGGHPFFVYHAGDYAHGRRKNSRQIWSRISKKRG